MRITNATVKCFCLSATLLGSGCGEAWTNLTASLGGTTAGQRGPVGAVVINNTPYRAVFTLGSYDQTDENHVPDFDQYDLDDGGLILEGNDHGGVQSFRCARVFSLGGPRLLDLIERNASDADVSDEALIEGIELFETAAGAEPTSRGLAPPFEVLLGVDFPCHSLLIFRIEQDGDDSFRIDYELIPSSSTR